VVCLAALCGLTLAERGGFQPLIPYTTPDGALPLEFLQTAARTQTQAQTRSQSRASYPNQQFIYPVPPNYNGYLPPSNPGLPIVGGIPNISPLTPVATANPGDIVSVGNVNQAGPALPPPPQYTPDIEPLANCLGCPEQIQLNMEENRISNLLTRINNKQKAIDDHEFWIDAAKESVRKVDNQIEQTEDNRQQLQEEMDQLMKEKAEFEAQVKADQLSSDLKAFKAQKKDAEKESQHLDSAARAIERLEGELKETTKTVGKELNLKGPALKAKLQELQDSESPLVRPFEEKQDGM